MIRFILHRLAWIVPNIFLLTFLLLAVVNGWLGSPAAMMLGDEATPEAIAEMKATYGFDQPIIVQYVTWVGNALQGDFGRSYSTQQSVGAMIGSALPVTIELGLWAIAVALLISVGLNSMGAAPRLLGGLNTALSLVGITIPTFMLGASLIYIFSVVLLWLPTTGWVPWSQGAGDHLRHLIMPVIALSAYYAGTFSMVYRAEYRTVQRQLFVRVASAKGLSDTSVALRHILPNSLIPVITYVGLTLGQLVGGAVVTETVFSIPGMGQLFVRAIGTYDYPVVLAASMVLLTGVMISNMLADIAQALINPQIRL